MKITEEIIEQLKADLSDAKTYEVLMGKDGAIKKLIAIYQIRNTLKYVATLEK